MARHWEPGYTGPLPGNYLEFLSPFLRKDFAVGDTSPESRVICYCKEAVGLGLGMPLSPARMGVFSGGDEGNNAQTNAGFTFSKRANKGANQFKLLLRPGTELEVTFFHPETFREQTEGYVKKSVSLSFDSSVSVTEMKLWLAGASNAQGPLMANVYALQTPSLKIHPLGSKGNPDLRIPVTSAMTTKATELGIQLISVGN